MSIPIGTRIRITKHDPDHHGVCVPIPPIGHEGIVCANKEHQREARSCGGKVCIRFAPKALGFLDRRWINIFWKAGYFKVITK